MRCLLTRPTLSLGLALGLLVGPACRTESVSSGPVHDVEIAYADTGRVWEVRSERGLIGFVVSFTETGAAGRTFFSVRNPSHQELGMIDGHGRFYRYHPHERDPEWLGAGTVREGALRILDAGADAELIERPRSVERPADGE